MTRHNPAGAGPCAEGIHAEGTTRQRQNGPSLLAAAVAYCRRGWHVFPCGSRSKKPLADSAGYLDAVCDVEKVRRHWEAHRDHNVALACGASGLVVVDVDNVTSWCQLLESTRNDDPITLETATPRGGTHLYFTAPPSVEIRNSAGRLAPGVDIRGEGGYIVAPPSQTPAGTYEIVRNVEPLPLPAWIIERLAYTEPPRAASPPPLRSIHGGGYGAAALREEVTRVRCAAEGTRNDTLNRSAFNLGELVAAQVLDAGEVVAELTSAARACGLGDAEIQRTVTSGLRGGLAKPRTANR